MLRIGIDIGGTFTDVVGWRGSAGGAGVTETLKVPSTPPDFATGFRNGVEALLERLPPGADEPVMVVHGTTVATNTVIERSGATVALLVTEGFKDILELARLKLPQSMQFNARRPAPLVPRDRVLEVPERLHPDGSVRREIDLDAALAAATEAKARGATAIAVAFLHAFRNPAHERAVRDAILAAHPDLDVTLSSDVWPRLGEYERATLAVLNAFVKARMAGYIGEVEAYLAARLPEARLYITRSNGGAMAAAEARRFPVQTLLSGPASGVTAAQQLGRLMEEPAFLTMDMGGTSTDLSLIRDGHLTLAEDAEVGEFPLAMPVTGIEAIGAGGGSIVAFDEAVLRVGPQSAGARPGPACFGKGGTLPTVTDAYVLCGYVDPDNFLGGQMRLDPAEAEAAYRGLGGALAGDPAGLAEAAISVATSNMVASVLPYLARHGVDAENLTLVLFGGAGSVHGPLLAREVGINRVLIPNTPSVFCAYGGLVTELMEDFTLPLQGVGVTSALLADSFAAMAAEARGWLAKQLPRGLAAREALEHWVELRYRGQSFNIAVELPEAAAACGDMEALRAAFLQEYRRLYVHADPAGEIEVVELRLRIRGALAAPGAFAPPAATALPAPRGMRQARFDGAAREVMVWNRRDLPAGHTIAGPAIIEQEDTTILLPPDFTLAVQPSGELILYRKS